MEINDRVEIISECNSKGQTGVVINTFTVGYIRECKYVMVCLDNGIKQGYNQRTVRKLVDEEKGRSAMEGFKYIAIVNLLDDCNKRDYAFALYDTEFIGLNVGDLVVTNPRNKNNRILGIVKHIKTVDEYCNGVTAQVVGVVNMNGYTARVEESKRQKERQEKRDAIEAELDRRISELRDIEFYERMANEYRYKYPALKKLVEELKELLM